MLSKKFLNLYLECKQQQLFWSVKFREFRATALRAGNFENFGLSSFRVGGRILITMLYIKQRVSCEACNRISIVSGFSCGPAKAIRIRY